MVGKVRWKLLSLKVGVKKSRAKLLEEKKRGVNRGLLLTEPFFVCVCVRGPSITSSQERRNKTNKRSSNRWDSKKKWHNIYTHSVSIIVCFARVFDVSLLIDLNVQFDENHECRWKNAIIRQLCCLTQIMFCKCRKKTWGVSIRIDVVIVSL